ncbi:MAG: pirin family protein [Acidobacteriota bacterium]|nr:pirin family protein [Blastocatellia bacterium]MDW8239683.1 pirin family protein [Acidobacteriota bacterium]
MITRRASHERGHTQLSWLDSRHTFSFDRYWDPRYMGFRALRVLNEDWIQPGQGFGMHPHSDMEIITYVLDGALEHRDSLGTGSVIYPGDGQRMTAGAGIRHSEYNHSQTEPVHLLQIWILPQQRGLEPGYEQKQFPMESKRQRWCLMASEDGRDGSVTVHQDVRLFVTILEPGQQLDYSLDSNRHAWLQVARGAVTLNGMALDQGDGAAISDERWLELKATQPAELLLFDLA